MPVKAADRKSERQRYEPYLLFPALINDSLINLIDISENVATLQTTYQKKKRANYAQLQQKSCRYSLHTIDACSLLAKYRLIAN